MLKHPLSYLWRELLQTLAMVAVVVALSIVALRLSTPYFAKQLPHLKYWAEFKIQHPLEVENLSLVWKGPRPALRLSKVQLLDEARENTRMTAEEIDIVINPLDSLVNGAFQLGSLSIRGASLSVGPMPAATEEVGLAKLFEKLEEPLGEEEKVWLDLFETFPIRDWILLDSALNLTDAHGKRWSLTAVEAVVRRYGDALKIRAKATLSGATPAHLSFGGDFEAFFTQPTGKFYMQGSDLPLRRFAQWATPTMATQIPKGRAAFELWGALDENTRPSDIRLHLEGKDLQFLSKTKKTEKFDTLEGNLWWMRSADQHQWRIFGHQFALSTAHTKEKITSAFALSQDSSDNVPRYQLQAKTVDLNPWVPFLIQAQWLPEPMEHALIQYLPSGTIAYLSATYAPTPTPWGTLWATGENMGLTLPEVGYQFQGLNLEISTDLISGITAFHAPALQYARITHPEEQLQFEDFQGQVYWFKDAKNWRIQGLSHRAHLLDGVGNIAVDYHLQLDELGALQSVAALGSLDVLRVEDIARNIPKVQAPKLHGWLQEALKMGEVSQLQLVYRDNFQPSTAPVLHAHAYLQNGTLDYFAPWPALTGLEGQLVMDGRALQIQVTKGKIAPEIPITATAFIADIAADVPVVFVDGHLEGALPAVVPVLKPTILADSVGYTLDRFHAQGNFDLGLTLHIPLNDDPLTLRGLLALKDNQMTFDFWQPIALEHIRGDIQFSEKHLAASGLQAIWHSAPILATMQANFETESNSHLGLLARSTIDTTFLKNWLDVPQLPIQGLTTYEVDVSVPLGEGGYAGHVVVRSALEGIEVDLPTPFFKPAATRKDYKLDLHLEADDRIGVLMQYGSDISLAQRFQLQGKQWLASQGHLHFGVHTMAGFQEKYPFLIDGAIAQVRVADWVSVMDRFSRPVVVSATKNKRMLKNTPVDAAPDSPVFDPYVDLEIEDLNLWGWVFPQTHVKLQHYHHDWVVQTTGPSLSGKMLIPAEKITNKSTIVLDMQQVTIPPMPSKKGKLEITDATPLPTIRFRSEKMHWADHYLEKVVLRLVPKKTGYTIERLQSEGKDLHGLVRGYWWFREPKKPFHTEGTLYVRDIGKILGTLHQPSAMQDASADLAFNLTSKGGANGLYGDLNFVFHKGRIMGVDPGFGRILSLLSVTNIQRRLTLDFSDITKQGFVFDDIHGKVQFDKDWARSANLQLRGPIADMDFNGHIGLSGDHPVQAEMRLSPNMTGSMPVAAVIASGGNPAVGAAVWLFNKMSDNQLNNIVQYHYEINGTWDDPQITEVAIVDQPTLAPVRKGKISEPSY